MLSDEEIEAAIKAIEAVPIMGDTYSLSGEDAKAAARAALEAAARVRAEDNAGGPVAWGEDIDGKIVSVRLDKSRHCTVPLYPAPQPSGMVKALTAIDEIITSSIQENGQPHRLKIGDEWHTGPAVDALYSILMGLRMVARSALTAGKPEQVPSGWQTIETAPKDGTPVLLARFDRPGFTDDDLGPDGATVGHWAHFPSGNGGWYLSGLGVVGDYGGDYHPGNGAFSNNGWPELDPTHWMPLPTPPTAGGGE